MTHATIQGDVLEWALEDAGVDRDEVLSVVGLSRRGVHRDHLSGKIEIDQEHLRYLATVTRRSPYFFALPTPPETNRHSVSANFRAPMSNAGQSRELTPDERAVVRDVKRRQSTAAKVSRELGHPPVSLLVLDPLSSPEVAAAKVARWLQWGTVQERRKRVKSKTQLFNAIRAALESRGIMTNLLPIEGETLRGFTLHHDRIPVIFVNAAVKHPAARSFTLLHELAHLLRGVDAACDRHDLQSRTSEEAWCNRFAAAFLMPSEDLAAYMPKYLKKGFVQAGDLDSIRRISNYFYCSYFSVAIRLHKLGFGDSALVDQVSGGYEEPEQTGFVPGGLTRPQKRLAAYGLGLARLLDAARVSTKVSEIELRKLLRLESGSELQVFFDLSRGSE